MRIRTRSLIVIPPLFLFLAISTALVAIVAGIREVRWGLGEESSSLAITVAEFVPIDVFSTDSVLAREEVAHLRRSLDRLMPFGQALRITVFDATGSPLVDVPSSEVVDAGDPTDGEDVWEEAIPPTPPAPSDSEREILLQEGRWVSPVSTSDDGSGYLTAYAPIFDRDLMLGSVGVQIPALRLAGRTARLRTAFVGAGLLIVGAGILATLLLAEYMKRSLRRLARAAAAVSSGKAESVAEIGGIREVEELSNTFDTMADILRDYLERGRRALIASDGPSEINTTIRTYRDRTLPPVEDRIAGRSVLATSLGAERTGALFGVATSEDQSFAFLGQISGPPTLATAIKAGTAARWLEGALELGRPIQEAVDGAASLFGIARLSVLAWPDGSPGSLKRVDGSKRDEPPPPGCSVCFIESADRVAVLHSLDEEGIRALDAYLNFFARGSEASISHGLRGALEGLSNGALVIVERS